MNMMLFYYILPESMLRNIPGLIKLGVLRDPGDLMNGVYFGIVLCVVRILLNIVIFRRMAEALLQLPKADVPKLKLPQLDKSFKNLKYLPSSKEIERLATINKINAIEVKRYLRAMRRVSVREAKIWKFMEATWRFAFTMLCYSSSFTLQDFKLLRYLAMLIYGIWALYGKLQLWAGNPLLHLFCQWPHHGTTLEAEYYYMFGVGIYVHLLMFQVFDTRRSDCLANTFHHLVTLSLLVSSWALSLTRQLCCISSDIGQTVGCLIMLLHDTSDVFLELAKVFNYLKINPNFVRWASPAADYIFVIFAISFYVNRLYFYPTCIVSKLLSIPYFEHIEDISVLQYTWSMAAFFSVFLCSLLGLNIMWSYLILRMIITFLNPKEELKDVRSDDEDEWDSNSDEDIDHSNGSSGNNKRTKNRKKNN